MHHFSKTLDEVTKGQVNGLCSLKARHRLERESWHINLGLRVHRALSWLDRAERCDDDDGRFIFLPLAKS